VKTKLIRSLFLSLGIAGLLHADLLTLQESIDKTVQHYPDAKALKLKTETSQLSYRSSRAAYLPQVNLDAQYNLTQTYVFPFNGSFNTKDDAGWSAGLNLKQKIWDFSNTSSKIKAAKVDTEISKLALLDFQALLAYRVKSLYKLMIVQSKAIKVRKEDVKAKEAYYAQAQALVKQGLKTSADASRFLSSLYSAKDNLAIARSSYEKAKNSLELYMGEKIDDGVALEDAVLQENFPVAKQTQKTLLTNNYSLKIDDKSIQKSKLLHKALKAEHYGSIDALASYHRISTLNSYDTSLVGVTLNIPLYNGGRISAEAQKAKLQTAISKEQKNSRELALTEELSNLLFDIKRYDKTIQAKKAQRDSAQETKKVLDGRYKEGLATYIEVLDATSLLLNAELGLLESYYLRALSIDRIAYLQGKLQ
jgi:outer membrane protein TolC